MKINLLVRSIIFFCLVAITQFCCRGQCYSVLFNFNGTNGGNSTTGLTLSGNTLYGTTAYEGAYHGGTIFRINTDGTHFTNLFNFQNGYAPTNGTGSTPYGNLTVSGHTIYGTTTGGGMAGNGVVFAIQTDGSGFTTLHEFTTMNSTNSDGGNPYGNLLLVSNTLYGTAFSGGIFGNGTVFAVQTDGTGFSNMYNFPASQGAPLGGLLASGNVLYGTTCGAGTSNGDGSPNYGSVFAMNMDGSGFTNLHIFNGADGSGSQSGLLLAGDTLYGTTFGGGPDDNGTVFAVKTNGTGFTNLHFFGPGVFVAIGYTNRDGAWPYDTPILHGDTLFATSSSGGILGWGTLFSVNTDGTGFRVYHSFDDDLDNGEPYGGLVLAGDTMYGVGQYGGPYWQSDGFVFSLSFAPQLNITPAGTNLVLSWPTNSNSFSYTNFVLEFSPSIGPNAAWTNAASQPPIVNENYVVTNSAPSLQMFYRLRGN